MASRLSKGLAKYNALRAEARWYDLLTSEGSLVLEVGERETKDARFDRNAFGLGTLKVATIANESGQYTLDLRPNHRGDVWSGGGWYTYYLTRTV